MCVCVCAYAWNVCTCVCLLVKILRDFFFTHRWDEGNFRRLIVFKRFGLGLRSTTTFQKRLSPARHYDLPTRMGKNREKSIFTEKRWENKDYMVHCTGTVHCNQLFDRLSHEKEKWILILLTIMTSRYMQYISYWLGTHSIEEYRIRCTHFF